MGLLDIFNTGDPQKDAAISRGLLQAGLQLMQSKGKFLPALSQGGMAGLGGYEHEVNRQLAAKRIGLQDQYLSNQIDQQKREAALANLPGQFIKPEMRGVDATGGMETAVENNTVPASMDLQGLIRAYMGAPGGIQHGIALKNAITPKVTAHSTAAGAKTTFTDDQGRVIREITNPAVEKPEKDPEQWRLYQLSGAQQRGVSFDDWNRANKRAGASNTTMYGDNLGLKPKDRFEMEGKLADDFKGITKLDNLVISASSKIRTALAQPGAIKDQAAIYSFAKLLDPEGAVREADYAAITNTTGLVDRVKNYLNQALTGEKLNETQRREMLTLMNAMEKVATGRISKAKDEFGAQARRYNLRPEAVTAGSSQDRVIDFNDLK
jgi:hypothetical protein